MKTILVTAFEPFGGEQVNPSWEAVKELDGCLIDGARVAARQLPCVFGGALDALYTQIDELCPDLVFCVGQAGGRADISVERVAINVNDARIPDNQGNQPIDTPVVAGGPAAYFATLPIKSLTYGLREAGIPASVSHTAGTFVCNHVMYGLLHYLATTQSPARGGFIHIPYLPEQATKHPGAPSMTAETVIAALETMIKLALRHHEDIVFGAGTTH